MMKYLFQIFRAGTHTPTSGAPLSFSAEALEKTAAVYPLQEKPAPLVLGHTYDGDRYGWVERLIAEGGKLFAFAEVSPALVNFVRSGSYKKVSACFNRPSTKENPFPDIFTLNHVAFLGAWPPAVKGMADPIFCEAEAILSFGEAAPPLSPPAQRQDGFGAGSAALTIHHRAAGYRQACPSLSLIESISLASEG